MVMYGGNPGIMVDISAK